MTSSETPSRDISTTCAWPERIHRHGRAALPARDARLPDWHHRDGGCVVSRRGVAPLDGTNARHWLVPWRLPDSRLWRRDVDSRRSFPCHCGRAAPAGPRPPCASGSAGLIGHGVAGGHGPAILRRVAGLGSCGPGDHGRQIRVARRRVAVDQRRPTRATATSAPPRGENPLSSLHEPFARYEGRPGLRGLLDCANRSAGRDNDPVGVPEQPSGSVLNQHSPLVAAHVRVPDFHPAAGVKGAKAGAVRPTSSRPARIAISGGSACSGSPGSRQRRSCRPCPRS
jgi:hypothetical protein